MGKPVRRALCAVIGSFHGAETPGRLPAGGGIKINFSSRIGDFESRGGWPGGFSQLIKAFVRALKGEVFRPGDELRRTTMPALPRGRA